MPRTPRISLPEFQLYGMGCPSVMSSLPNTGSFLRQHEYNQTRHPPLHWRLPIVETYRTLCIALPPAVREFLERIRHFDSAA